VVPHGGKQFRTSDFQDFCIDLTEIYHNFFYNSPYFSIPVLTSLRIPEMIYMAKFYQEEQNCGDLIRYETWASI
jgi:hypothetical protein